MCRPIEAYPSPNCFLLHIVFSSERYKSPKLIKKPPPTTLNAMNIKAHSFTPILNQTHQQITNKQQSSSCNNNTSSREKQKTQTESPPMRVHPHHPCTATIYFCFHLTALPLLPEVLSFSLSAFLIVSTLLLLLKYYAGCNETWSIKETYNMCLIYSQA